MARKPESVVLRPDGDKGLPPCATGDNGRDGPERPRWLEPSSAGSSGGYLSASDPAFRERFPTLSEFLTLTGLGGKARKTGTLLVFAEDGRFKACVNDRETGYYAFVAAEGFQALLEAVDAGLVKGLDWRVSKGFKGR